ncbi:MAG: hypothetical protein HXS43_01835 [Theionarchaea archaeon]|nr:hypothetical protein [Theionarchaea archaeon]
MRVSFKNWTLLDYAALSLIIVETVVLALTWDFLPSAELDTPYHLLMGKMFSDYDTVMLWDYYEYAPVGRPNLYPPLEHVLLWFMHDATGAEWWDIGRFISLIQYPLPLFTVWFFSRKLFNPLTALASVVVLSATSDFWFWQVSVAPTALIISLYPLFLYAFYKKRIIESMVLMASFLYLHLGLPYVIILGVSIFSVVSLYKTKEYIKQAGIVLGAAALLFLPWIIHIYMHQDWLKFGSPELFNVGSFLTGVNIITFFFFVIGGLSCVDKARKDLRYVLVLSAAAGFLAIAAYGWRYRMHSPIINCVITGIGFEAVYRKISSSAGNYRKVGAVFLLLLIPLGTYSLVLASGTPSTPFSPPQSRVQVPGPAQYLPLAQGPQPGNNPDQPAPPGFQGGVQPVQKVQPGGPTPSSISGMTLRVQTSPLLDMLDSLRTGRRPPRVWQITNPEIEELISWIIDNTSPDEILHMENGMLADYLALFTERRTDAGMYREVTTPELLQAVREGKKSGIFIIEQEKMRERGIIPEMALIAQFGDLLVLQGIKTQPVPKEMPFHLTDLVVPFALPQRSDQWIAFITDLAPRRVYLGVQQKDLENPDLFNLITRLSSLSEVGLTILVEDVHKPVSAPRVAAIRLLLPSEKLSLAYVKSVRSTLDPGTTLEIAILGPPITQNNTLVNTLKQIAPLTDRIVRHVSPNVEVIHAVREEQTVLGIPLFIQIDIQRGRSALTPQEIYLLLEAAHNVAENNVIIEIMYLPDDPEFMSFLRAVYAE